MKEELKESKKKKIRTPLSYVEPGQEVQEKTIGVYQQLLK